MKKFICVVLLLGVVFHAYCYEYTVVKSFADFLKIVKKYDTSFHKEVIDGKTYRYDVGEFFYTMFYSPGIIPVEKDGRRTFKNVSLYKLPGYYRIYRTGVLRKMDYPDFRDNLKGAWEVIRCDDTPYDNRDSVYAVHKGTKYYYYIAIGNVEENKDKYAKTRELWEQTGGEVYHRVFSRPGEGIGCSRRVRIYFE